MSSWKDKQFSFVTAFAIMGAFSLLGGLIVDEATRGSALAAVGSVAAILAIGGLANLVQYLYTLNKEKNR